MSDGMKNVSVHRDGAVLYVQLTRPDRGNVLDEALVDDLLAVLRGRPADLRTVVLSAVGPDFCLGGDRRELTGAPAAVPRIGEKTRLLFEALALPDLVTVAQLHGRAVGAGVGLAAACDLRIGSPDSTFRLPEAALGLPPVWGGALARIIGQIGLARTTEMVLTSRVIDATSAQQMGLLHTVAPTEELERSVRRTAASIARRPAPAIQMTKRILQAYAAPSRLADVGFLESDLMAGAIALAATSTSHNGI
ncbi:enoyl-CoA hydratase/isomerase family protein [Streptomyces luteireticuli]|uniref:enoyl-CoA hydratase/isomerase family protein n=1 Tax=Streptomyces luteireticuli TaxID=173858 RepID=UPI00355637F9